MSRLFLYPEQEIASSYIEGEQRETDEKGAIQSNKCFLTFKSGSSVLLLFCHSLFVATVADGIFYLVKGLVQIVSLPDRYKNLSVQVKARTQFVISSRELVPFREFSMPMEIRKRRWHSLSYYCCCALPFTCILPLGKIMHFSRQTVSDYQSKQSNIYRLRLQVVPISTLLLSVILLRPSSAMLVSRSQAVDKLLFQK